MLHKLGNRFCMALTESITHITVEEYLAGEQLSEIRHEYIGGAVYAMAGGSEAHNLICLNLATALRAQLRGKTCKVFMSDMKLRLQIAHDDIFYYPDLLVTSDPEDNATFYKTRPSVLVEVLSPSTERTDRREKFLSYQRLHSLSEYILISQDKLQVSIFRKANDWAPEQLLANDTLSLPSLAFDMPIAELYEDVTPAQA
jgi:Uma2 family endonuclease